MKTVIINSKWLPVSGLRIDASFHLSDGVKTKRIIAELCPYETRSLSDESLDLYKGGIHKRVYVPSAEHGLMFYSASDLFKLDLNSRTYISKKLSPHLKELELKKDWILITRSGTLGKVVLTSKDHEGKIGTDDLVRINPAEKSIKRGYLYAFLSSRYGHGLLTQSGYGGVVKHIEPHHIENILIPVFPIKLQQIIHELIISANDLRSRAFQSLKSAHEVFLNKIDMSVKAQKHSSIGFKRIENDMRLGGNFFLSIGDNYENQILKLEHSLLSNFAAKIYTSGRDKRNYTTKEKGVPFLSNGDIASLNPFAACNYLFRKNVKADSLIKENTILAGRVGQDTVGNVYFPYDSLLNSIASDNIIRIEMKDKKDITMIFAFLSSPIGYEIIRKRKTGVGQPFVTEEMFKTIPIPKISEAEKNHIHSKILSYKSDINSALLHQLEAIELVEKEIESWQK